MAHKKRARAPEGTPCLLRVVRQARALFGQDMGNTNGSTHG